MSDQNTHVDAEALVAWMLRWSQNAYQDDHEYTDAEIAKIADHYRRGVDAWESAAAINEKRDL